jgi:hypothetical protein
MRFAIADLAFGAFVGLTGVVSIIDYIAAPLYLLLVGR